MSGVPSTLKPCVVLAGAVDGPDGERVIDAAAGSVGNRVGAVLHILHLATSTALRSEETLALLEHGREAVAQVAADRHEAPQVRVVVHIRSGSPWRTISEEAEKLGADLVVIGTHGRRGAARLLLGSDGEQVLRHASCPVLFVRDGPARPPLPRVAPPSASAPGAPDDAAGSDTSRAEHARKEVAPHLQDEVGGRLGRGSWVIGP